MKWVYKTKDKSNGETNHFKVRLVAKGYKQKLDIVYFEGFVLVAILDSICMVLSLIQNK